MLTRIAVLVIAVLPFCFAARETRVARCVTAPPSAGYESRLEQIGSRLCVQGGTGYVLLENYIVGLTGRDMDAPNGWRIVVVAVRSDSLAVVGAMSVHRVDENPFGLVCTPDAVYLNANGSLMVLSPGLTTKQELNLPQKGVPYALVGTASDQYVMTEAIYDRQDVVTLFRKGTLQMVYRATFDARPLPPYADRHRNWIEPIRGGNHRGSDAAARSVRTSHRGLGGWSGSEAEASPTGYRQAAPGLRQLDRWGRNW